MIDSKGRIESAQILPLCALCGKEISMTQMIPGTIHGFMIGYQSRIILSDDVWFCVDCASRVAGKMRSVYAETVQEIAQENNMYKDGEE